MEINQLLLRALAQGRAVTIPGAGSLVVHYQPARQSSSTQVLPPLRTVVFVTDEQGTPLPEMVAAEAPELDFDRWMAEVVTPDGLHMDSVGDLRNGVFTAAPELEQALNPLGREPLFLRPRRRGLCWVFGLIGLFALVFGASMWYMRRVTLIERPLEVPVAAVEPVRTQPETVTVEPTETVVEPTAVESAATSDEITPTASGISYVVWGVYSSEANARRALRELQAALAREGVVGASPRVHFYADKWMVSAFESDSSASASDFIRTHAAPLRVDLWKYTKK